jgi:hypothetical protein
MSANNPQSVVRFALGLASAGCLKDVKKPPYDSHIARIGDAYSASGA